MLELQRNVIFGQFVDTGSPIHRLDARIKLLATALLVVASFLVDGFLGFALLLPLVVLIQAVSRVPFS
jgi:energy-coupling factor transport system permease protein